MTQQEQLQELETKINVLEKQKKTIRENINAKQRQVYGDVIDLIAQLNIKLKEFYELDQDNPSSDLNNDIIYQMCELTNDFFEVKDLYDLDDIKDSITDNYDMNELYDDEQIKDYVSDKYCYQEVYDEEMIKDDIKESYDLMERYDAIEWAIEILRGAQ